MPPDLPSLQSALLHQLQQSGAATQPAILDAFRAVPRHLFLPGRPLEEVYRDEAIPTKLAGGQAISSSSQPAMMAIMLEQLDLAPGQNILEIGAGTGYNAALLGHLVGPTGRVVTVDIDQDLVDDARGHLAAAGAANVLAVCADGGLGYPPAAPYDRIILTVGAWDLAPAWVEQLKPGGLLVLPLALGAGPQKSIAFEKPVDPQPGPPTLTSRSLRDCGFMRLRGAFAGPEQLAPLGPAPGLLLSTAAAPPAALDTVYAWLTGPGHDAPTSLQVAPREAWESLNFWLSVHAPNTCELIAEGEPHQRPPIPCLFEFEGSRPICICLGLLSDQGLCLLWLKAPGPLAKVDPLTPRELWARAYGPQGAYLQAAIQQVLLTWHAAGRPGTQGMRVRAYPVTAPPPAVPGAVYIPKRFTCLVIDWPQA